MWFVDFLISYHERKMYKRYKTIFRKLKTILLKLKIPIDNNYKLSLDDYHNIYNYLIKNNDEISLWIIEVIKDDVKWINNYMIKNNLISENDIWNNISIYWQITTDDFISSDVKKIRRFISKVCSNVLHIKWISDYSDSFKTKEKAINDIFNF